MKPQPDDPTKGFFATMAALLVIGTVTIALLWLLSFFCMKPPSSPLNMARWTCGAWSGFLGVGIIVAGFVLSSIAWAAINRRM